MKDWVIWWSLTFSVGSFGLFTVTMLAQAVALWRAPGLSKPVVDEAVAKSVANPAADVSLLINSVKGLVDALSKANPSLMALASAVIFMAIAGVASGAITTS
ncbi:hypothetical protein N2597_22575 (plasmid) [Rhizobium sophoriradicis]|uniref:hypothetical protein n=1 Tax=Rhizobium sophoriradicis TaxID=1535245 RepID=UPI0016117424|nr:hypothetical protein N2597_22575 [Rhizobium leguminosarum bv. phaseoli]